MVLTRHRRQALVGFFGELMTTLENDSRIFEMYLYDQTEITDQDQEEEEEEEKQDEDFLDLTENISNPESSINTNILRQDVNMGMDEDNVEEEEKQEQNQEISLIMTDNENNNDDNGDNDNNTTNITVMINESLLEWDLSVLEHPELEARFRNLFDRIRTAAIEANNLGEWNNNAHKMNQATKEQLQTLPRIVYSRFLGCSEIKEWENNHTSCSICLSNFNMNTNVTPIPCGHLFHHRCIKTWLNQNSICPLCKKVVEWDRIKDIDKRLPHLRRSIRHHSTSSC